ncbi:MAG: serine/threonine-protein kinase, partial [Thermosynechococcaceae cyanobacterium]
MTFTSNQTSRQALHQCDRYTIEQILDADGIGQVSLARDTQLDQPVVIKTLKEPLIDSAEMHQLFERAIKLRAALGSEHVAQVLDSGMTSEGFPFYVMQYLQGESLKQCLQRKHKLSPQQAIDIACQICVALETAHKNRFEHVLDSDEPFAIVPHELKPSHVFLVPTDGGEQVTLLDCGITTKLRNYCCESQGESGPSVLPDTFHYAAPEQLELGEQADHQADIYVLGIILYEMLSGTDPFGLGLNSRLVSEVSWLHAHALQAPRSLQSSLGESQAALELSNIVMKCLAKDPRDRDCSIQALRQSLEHVEPIDVQPDVADEYLIVSDKIMSQAEPETQTSEASPHAELAQQFSFAFDKTEKANLIWPPFQTVPSVETHYGSFSPLPFDSLSNALDGTDASNSAQEIVPDETMVQYANPVTQPPIDQTMAQTFTQDADAYFEAPPEVEETMVQYSDSAIHNPADQTVAQILTPLDEQPADQTMCQQSSLPVQQSALGMVKTQHRFQGRAFVQTVWRSRRNVPSVFINFSRRCFYDLRRRLDFRRWRSVPQLPAAGVSQSLPPRNPVHSHIHSKEGQVSTEQHQKSLRELDQCRLSLAKELARNGK